MKNLTAVYKKSGKWYLGWIEEIQGVNTQGKTLREVRENLKDALTLVLESNRKIFRKNIKGELKRESVSFA